MADRQGNVVKHDYSLLKPEEEDALHKSRLLPIEQRPFQRLTKRLLSPDSLLLKRPTLKQLPSPPPEATADDSVPSESNKGPQTTEEEQYSQFREDMLLDFVLFDSTMVRIQLLRNSNEKERARYATEKSKIIETSDSVRLNITQLRQELEEEQRKLALRKQYDELTEKITSNRMLRPREDQEAQLEKLEKEIAELEEESRDYARTWAERREQFGKIKKEAEHLQRIIRDEKEEAERKEGMERAAMDGEDVSTREQMSTVGTPGLEPDGTTPMQIQGTSILVADPDRLRPPVTPASGSRAASPGRQDGSSQQDESQDVEMGDTAGTPVNVESDIEEGEEQEEDPELMEVS